MWNVLSLRKLGEGKNSPVRIEPVGHCGTGRGQMARLWRDINWRWPRLRTVGRKTNINIAWDFSSLAEHQKPFLSTVKRRKLVWFSKVTRHNIQTVLQRTLEGNQGGQRTNWFTDIMECSLHAGHAQRRPQQGDLASLVIHGIYPTVTFWWQAPDKGWIKLRNKRQGILDSWQLCWFFSIEIRRKKFKVLERVCMYRHKSVSFRIVLVHR